MTSAELVEVTTGEFVPHYGVSRITPDQAKEQAEWVRDMRRSVLVLNTDYGIIPGTDKPCLYKPGAEMLLLAAGLGSTTKRTEIDYDDQHRRLGVYYVTTIHRGEQVVAESEGYAGYDESRFFTSREDAEQKERANAARYERPVRTDKFVEFRASWNSLIKMAQKRSFVGATLLATAASGLFTQDIEDDQPQAERPTPAKSADDVARERGWDSMSAFEQAKDHARRWLKEQSGWDEDRQRQAWADYQRPDGPESNPRMRTSDEHALWCRSTLDVPAEPGPDDVAGTTPDQNGEQQPAGDAGEDFEGRPFDD